MIPPVEHYTAAGDDQVDLFEEPLLGRQIRLARPARQVDAAVREEMHVDRFARIGRELACLHL
jgi:hypothetical protein